MTVTFRSALRLTLVVLLGAPATARGGEFRAVRPAAGAQLTRSRPAIEFAGLLGPGDDPATFRILVDGTDLGEFQRWRGDRLRVVCPLPLVPGAHQAVLQSRAPGLAPVDLASVRFTVVPPGRASLAEGSLAFPPLLELDTDNDADSFSLAPNSSGTLAGDPGRLAYQAGFSHRFRLHGPDEDVVAPSVVADFERGRLGARGGSLREVATYAGSELVGSDSHRKAIEGRFGRGAAGAVSIFSNLLDALPSVSGDRRFRQRMHGLAWRAPVGGDRLSLSVLGLTVRDQEDEDPLDTGDSDGVASLATTHRATMLGLLGRLALPGEGLVEGEVVRGARKVAEGGSSQSSDDWAMRLGYAGTLAGHKLSARVLQVGSRFLNPARPSLRNDRREAAVELSGRRAGLGYDLNLRVGRDGLERRLRSSDELRYGLAVSRRLPAAFDLRLSGERQQVDSRTGDRDQSRAQLSLARRSRALRLQLAAGWSELSKSGRGAGVTSTRQVKGSWLWRAPRGFELGGGAGLDERVGGDRETHQGNLYLEPAWSRDGDRLRLALQLSRSTLAQAGRDDQEQLAARGALSLKLPPAWRGASLTIDGGWTSEDDRRGDGRRSDRRIGLQLGFTPTLGYGGR